MILLFQSTGLFLFWCSVMLTAIGISCLIFRAIDCYKALNQPVITPLELALMRAKYQRESK